MKTKPCLEVLEGRGLLSTLSPTAGAGEALFSGADQLGVFGRASLQPSQQNPQFFGPSRRSLSPLRGGHLWAKATVKQLIDESAQTGQPSSTSLTFTNSVASASTPPTVIDITFTPGNVHASPSSGDYPALTVSYASGPSYLLSGQSVTYTYYTPSSPSPVIHIGKSVR